MPKAMARVLNAERVRREWREKKRKEREMPEDREDKKRKGCIDEKGRGKAQGLSGIKPGESLRHFEQYVINNLVCLASVLIYMSTLSFCPPFPPLRCTRRVEDDMRPLVRSAMKQVGAIERKANNEALQETDELKASSEKTTIGRAKEFIADGHRRGEPSTKSAEEKGLQTHGKVRPKEFVVVNSSLPRRLNDVAQAPPEIKAPKRLLKFGDLRLSRSGDSDNDVEDVRSESIPDPGSKKRGNSKLDVLTPAQRRLMEVERSRAVQRYRMLKEARMKAKGRINGV